MLRCKDCKNMCKVIGANITAENCLDFQPKEKEMEKQKFQFENEEQAREIGLVFSKVLKKCGDADCEENNKDCTICFVNVMRNMKRIRKSELETLVEEVEEILIHNLTQNTEYINFEKQEKILNTIQALKKEVERLKK
jgi:hypothetical protein